MALLPERDDVVDGVLDLRDHVLGALVLVILQIGLDCVKSANLLVKSNELLCISHGLHKIRVTANISDRLEQVLALLHDEAVRLDASLLGLAGGRGLSRPSSGARSRSTHFALEGASLGEVIAGATVNRRIVLLGLGSA